MNPGYGWVCKQKTKGAQRAFMKIEITKTLDGSDTLYRSDIDEHYHSTFGAIQESRHIFIQAGFESCPLKEIRILEIGFGTGLNCLLTLLAAHESGRKVRYQAIEKYPLPLEIWSKLNYSAHLSQKNSEQFSLMHNSPWDKEVIIDPQFLLYKMEADLLEVKAENLPQVDLIYFDAFSPEKQPELWNFSIFEKLYSKLEPRGILVTYCAKGAVRRDIQSVGFQVERIPGPPGKREMIRAIKI